MIIARLANQLTLKYSLINALMFPKYFSTHMLKMAQHPIVINVLFWVFYLSWQLSIILDGRKKKNVFCLVQMFHSCSLAPSLPRACALVAFTLGFVRGFASWKRTQSKQEQFVWDTHEFIRRRFLLSFLTSFLPSFPPPFLPHPVNPALKMKDCSFGWKEEMLMEKNSRKKKSKAWHQALGELLLNSSNSVKCCLTAIWASKYREFSN